MEATRFDQIATTLATSRSRRGALGLLAGGAVALLGSNTQAANDRRRKTRQQPRCIPAGKAIKLKNNARHPGHKCCDLMHKESPRRGLCCKPNGATCESARQCCLGVCSAGVCQDTAIQVPLPPLCAKYGQACTTTADCCPLAGGTTTPCIGGLCRFP